MKKSGQPRKKKGQTWELINPEGIVHIEPMPLNRHPGDLKGKKIMLRWNAKHNGDIFLNRIAERLTYEIKGARVIKAWDVSPDTVVAVSGGQEQSRSLAESCAAFKPDIVIGAYGD